MRIRILKPGILSTIQDMGRQLYRTQAVPVSGVMDTLSARIANKVLDNSDDAAVIEFTYANAAFKAESDILIAYAGDSAILQAGTQVIPAERPVFIPAGTQIQLTSNQAGARTYLAVAGGWQVPEVLGSHSTYLLAAFGGLQGRALQAGDVLCNTKHVTGTTKHIWNSLQGLIIRYAGWSLSRYMFLPANRKTIRVVPAQEFTWFNSQSVINFLSASYTLNVQSNRMGYRLEGAAMVRLRHDELLSTAVAPGTIQVTGDGSLILLMADCQTTGGYPRIAQVAAVDMPLCGQLKPSDTINFKEISRHEAEMLYIEREQQLHELTLAVKSRFL